MVVDESTCNMGIKTKKSIYSPGIDNIQKIPSETPKSNFFGAISFYGESLILPIENLDKFECGNCLLEVRYANTESESAKEILNEVIENSVLSKKEIREKIAEEGSSNEEFIEKLLRSINNNSKDSLPVIARKIEKHAKRESTENSKKQKEVKEKHVPNLLKECNMEFLMKNEKRIVLILDNAPGHYNEYIRTIAKLLNIYLIYLPPYSPDLNPTEGSWKYSKHHIRGLNIKTKQDLINAIMKFFKEITETDSLYRNFYIKFIQNFF